VPYEGDGEFYIAYQDYLRQFSDTSICFFDEIDNTSYAPIKHTFDPAKESSRTTARIMAEQTMVFYSLDVIRDINLSREVFSAQCW